MLVHTYCTRAPSLLTIAVRVSSVVVTGRENRDQSRFCPAIWTPTRTPRLVSTSQVCYGCPIATCATYVLWC